MTDRPTPETDAVNNGVSSNWRNTLLEHARSLERRLAEAEEALNDHCLLCEQARIENLETRLAEAEERDAATFWINSSSPLTIPPAFITNELAALRAERDRLQEALEPFAALDLGPSGYCSFPLTGMVEEAKAALAGDGAC